MTTIEGRTRMTTINGALTRSFETSWSTFGRHQVFKSCPKAS
ncbi:Protein kinase domain-containing protein [Psidium guajava]|nr:Protein kinase domain-containing protein [Psidium guajava]